MEPTLLPVCALAITRISSAGWRRLAWADLAAFAVGAGIIPIWTFFLPTHTFIHAGFMARILIVPVALSWAAFLWQLYLQGARSSYRWLDHCTGG